MIALVVADSTQSDAAGEEEPDPPTTEPTSGPQEVKMETNSAADDVCDPEKEAREKRIEAKVRPFYSLYSGHLLITALDLEERGQRLSFVPRL